MIILRAPVLHPYSHRKLVLLSGLSDPRSCRLSPIQEKFLLRTGLPQHELILANFPYVSPQSQTIGAAAHPISLSRASWNNAKQFLSAHKHPYRNAAIQHWQSLIESCGQLVVITLSCGLEILNCCLTSGEAPDRLSIIALGPVAWKRPEHPHLLVRGRRDLVSLPFFPKADVLLPQTGHMNYLESPKVLEIVQSYL